VPIGLISKTNAGGRGSACAAVGVAHVAEDAIVSELKYRFVGLHDPVRLERNRSPG